MIICGLSQKGQKSRPAAFSCNAHRVFSSIRSAKYRSIKKIINAKANPIAIEIYCPYSPKNCFAAGKNMIPQIVPIKALKIPEPKIIQKAVSFFDIFSFS